MYSRVTLVEIDTLRTDVDDAVARFEQEVVPRLEAQGGYRGAAVLATPEGRGMIVTLWDSEAEAVHATDVANAALAQFASLFRSPPGREYYGVAYLDVPSPVHAS